MSKARKVPAEVAKRTEVIYVRLTPAEKLKIAGQAVKARRTTADHARVVLLEHAEQEDG